MTGSCLAWEGSSAAISDGSSGRDGGGGATVVPHTMVGSSSRVDSTYFCTEDFSASSASRAALFSAWISFCVWRAENGRRVVVVVVREVRRRGVVRVRVVRSCFMVLVFMMGVDDLS